MPDLTTLHEKTLVQTEDPGLGTRHIGASFQLTRVPSRAQYNMRQLRLSMFEAPLLALWQQRHSSLDHRRRVQARSQFLKLLNAKNPKLVRSLVRSLSVQLQDVSTILIGTPPSGVSLLSALLSQVDQHRLESRNLGQINNALWYTIIYQYILPQRSLV